MSIRSVWNNVFFEMHLQFGSIELNLEPDQSPNTHLIEVYNYLAKVVDYTNQVLNKQLSINKSDLLYLIEESFFNQRVKDKVKPSLHYFCERTINCFMYPTIYTFDKEDNVLEKMHKILNNSSIEIVSIEIFEESLSKYLKSLTTFHLKRNRSIIDLYLTLHSYLVKNSLCRFMFPNSEYSGPKIEFYYQTFYDSVFRHAYEIVLNFESYKPILVDLYRCMSPSISCSSMKLCQEIEKEINQRLIHSAVSTPALVRGFINLIKSLRILDASASMECICVNQLRKYIVRRDDAIKAIVDKILSLDENMNEPNTCRTTNPVTNAVDCRTKNTNSNHVLDYSDIQCDIDDIKNWTPAPNRDNYSSRDAPIELYPVIYSNFQSTYDQLFNEPDHKIDILDNLLNMYNSLETFVAEYKNLLSQRLIYGISHIKGGPDYERERRSLESLKQKFGASSGVQIASDRARFFLDCEVMLKDLSDSEHHNKVIQDKIRNEDDDDDEEEVSETEQGVEVSVNQMETATESHDMMVDNNNTTLNKEPQGSLQEHKQPNGSTQFQCEDLKAYIISNFYWGRFPDRDFKLPSCFQSKFRKFSRTFSKYKRNRELKWKSSIGLVTLELELNGNAPMEFQVKPIDAAIAHLFTQQEKWSVNNIANQLQTLLTQVKKSLHFWMVQGLLIKIDENTYQLAPNGQLNNSTNQASDNSNNEISCIVGLEEPSHFDDDEDEASQINPETIWPFLNHVLLTERVSRRMNSNGPGLDILSLVRGVNLFFGNAEGNTVSREFLEALIEEKIRTGEVVVVSTNRYIQGEDRDKK